MEDAPLGKINSTYVYLNGGYESNLVFAEECYEANKETGELIGTAFAVRDMFEIVDSLGEDGMLRYYGLSYGTALGSYAAAMFPDRIESMILDANIDPYEYQDGSYLTNLADLDASFEKFLEMCIKSGDRCSLAKYTEAETVEDLYSALNAVFEPLADEATESLEGAITYTTLKFVGIQQPLYFAYQWPDLADALTSLLNGSTADSAETDAADADAADAPAPYDRGIDSVNGIRCGDSLTRITSPEEYLDTIKAQAEISSFGDVGYQHTWLCSVWPFTAKEQYTGTFEVKTRNPILYINGEYDPATSISAAKNASAGFEGSVVLTHGGFGHGVMFHGSECTDNAIKTYLEDGTLPEEGTVCEPDVPNPWDLTSLVQEVEGADS
jgi:pimeloyl-ACP methyl ester carboxylesterase